MKRSWIFCCVKNLYSSNDSFGGWPGRLEKETVYSPRVILLSRLPMSADRISFVRGRPWKQLDALCVRLSPPGLSVCSIEDSCGSIYWVRRNACSKRMCPFKTYTDYEQRQCRKWGHKLADSIVVVPVSHIVVVSIFPFLLDPKHIIIVVSIFNKTFRSRTSADLMPARNHGLRSGSTSQERMRALKCWNFCVLLATVYNPKHCRFLPKQKSNYAYSNAHILLFLFYYY